MVQAVPVAIRLESTDLADMLRKTPVFLLAIIVTASSNKWTLQKQGDKLLRHVIAHKVMVQGKKRHDLFYSLLTYLNWYRLRFDPDTQNFYQLLQLANAMASDLDYPRIFGRPPGAVMTEESEFNMARSFILCYYLNVGSATLAYDRPENMQCFGSLRNAAIILQRSSNDPLDQSLRGLVDLMDIVYQHWQTLRCCQLGMNKLTEQRQKTQLALEAWERMNVGLQVPPAMLSSFHFILAYTLLKFNGHAKPIKQDWEAGIHAFNALFANVLEQDLDYLVKLGTIEWAHLLTAFFMLPKAEKGAKNPDIAADIEAPVTLYYVDKFRSRMNELQALAESDMHSQAQNWFVWLERILQAVEKCTKALAATDDQPAVFTEGESARELIHSFVDSMPEDGGADRWQSRDPIRHNPKEEFWGEFMSDWLEW
jgi:hypothetical protein